MTSIGPRHLNHSTQVASITATAQHQMGFPMRQTAVLTNHVGKYPILPPRWSPQPLLFPQLTRLGPVHCVSYSSGIGQYVPLPTNPPLPTHNSLTKPTDPDRRLRPEECAPPPPPLSSPLPLTNSSPLSSHAHKPHDRYPPPILYLTRLRSSLPQYLSRQQHLCLRWR